MTKNKFWLGLITLTTVTDKEKEPVVLETADYRST